MPVATFPLPTEAAHHEGWLEAPGGLRLYWQRYRPAEARAAVAILHGGGDHGGRFPAITAALAKAGFEVWLLDFRGHGKSGGEPRFHVDRFEDYLVDLDLFLAKVMADAAGKKLFVLGHSQGALVATRWALEHPGAVAGYVFTSPYYRLAFRGPVVQLKILFAKTVGRLLAKLPVATGFKPEHFTQDVDMQRWTEADPLYVKTVTPRAFSEGVRAQAEVMERLSDFKDPVLVLAAGADPIADAEAAAEFVQAAGATDKRFVKYEGMRHEIFNELERDKPVAEAVRWLSERAAGAVRDGVG